MENNKAYLRNFGIIFLIAIISGVSLIAITGSKPEAYDRTRFLQIILQTFPVLLLFVNTGIATQKWKAATGSIAAFIGVVILQYIFYSQKGDEHINRGLLFFLQELLYTLPYFVFFLFVKAGAEKLPFLFLALLLLIGMNNLYQSGDGVDWLEYLFRINLHIPPALFRVIDFVTEQIFIVVFMCELLNYAEGKSKGFQPRLINPGNEYNKLNATVIYWSLKTFLWLSLFGTLSIVKSYNHFFSSSYTNPFTFLKWYYLVSLLFSSLLMFAVAWYLRKFLLEYFITYNFTSRFLYWFLLLPGVGFIAWLVMLADSQKQTTFKQRQKSLEDFSAGNTGSIIAVFILLISIRFILSLMAEQWQGLLTLLVSAVLFAMIVLSRTGYYLNLWLNFLVLALLMVFLVTGTNKDSTVLLYPLLLLNTVQLILIYPAFHFEAFNYLSYEEEEKSWHPGQDLF
jgi:hypothetical protein